MSRLLSIIAASGIGAGGFWLGAHPAALYPFIDRARALFPRVEVRASSLPTAAKPVGVTAYYRDPDGRPIYASTPRKTADGRDFVGIDASADLRFAASGSVRPDVVAPVLAVPDAVRKIKFYRNPMGLPDTSPAPKTDSMGMDYIPVFEGEDTDGKTVSVSPGKLQRTGVQSQPVERRRIVQSVRVPGSVQPDERLISIVATRSDAYVETVENVTTGDLVRKGQPLVTVYSPEINSAAAQYVSNPGFEGSLRRLKNLNVSDQAIAEMSRTRQVPTAVMWSAPRDGVVLERGAVDGMKAAAGATLFRIADLSTVWVLADVPEQAVGAIRVGQTASVRIRAMPNRAFTGRIALIYPQLVKDTRSTRVRIELPNPQGLLLADMYVDVEIATGTPDPVLAVPDDAIIDTGTGQTVILDRGNGKLEPRTVTLGARGDGYTAIEDGVSVGDKVVTSANFLIDAESNLKAALEGLSAAATPSETKP